MDPARTNVPSPLLWSEPAKTSPCPKETVLVPVFRNTVSPGVETASLSLRSNETSDPYSRLPPLKLTGPLAPRAEAFPSTNVPPPSVVPPVYELTPFRVKEPLPIFVREPAPVRAPEKTVATWFAPTVSASG